MKTRLIISFAITVAMIFVLRWQGESLRTPVSPNGIIDVEFAKSSERLKQLQLFLNNDDLKANLYLDFIFIAGYSWFLFACCNFFAEKKGQKAGVLFSSVALSGGMFDVAENILLLMILNGKFNPSLILFIYYIAALKFLLIAAVLLYLVISLASLLLKRKSA